MELELGKEVEEQRFHFKAGAGGLVDIEFATQLLQLKYGWQNPELRVPNTLVALKKLHALQLLEQSQFRHLYEGYEFLRLLENRLRVTSPHGLTSFFRTPKSLCKMARLLGSVSAFPSGESFEKAYLAHTQNIRSVFREIISSLSNSHQPQQPEPRP
jgi:glutamate-ammonia-ligase adenylyltransferase